LTNARFPTVVCEAGWSESHEELKQDARLWLLHTNGETRVVIILSFTESNPSTTSTHVAVDTETQMAVNPENTEEEEKTVLAGIDENTDPHYLAGKLFELNQEGKLKKPLIGNISASLYIYKATENGQDIVETFMATLLPPPSKDSDKAALPKHFGISVGDILGDSLPEGHKSDDEIQFCLADLQSVIKTSIPRTARLRATKRALQLLKNTVGFDDESEQTFTQRKRQRVAPIGTWK